MTLVDRLVGRRPDRRVLVAVCALAAFLLRIAGMGGPIGSDEAGFLLVARSWSPEPDSLYGHYFVDRPPLLLAVYRYAAALDSITAVRLLGAVACALLVLTAAATARLVSGDRAQVWVAAYVAAVVTHPLIDPIDVKGELLGLPLVMAGCWLALSAVRRESAGIAVAAGLCASLAAGFKQNLLSALVFAGVLLLASTLTGRLHWRAGVRLGLAGLLGVLVHPLATVGWSLWAGVELDTLWYAVAEFRLDAGSVLAERPSPATTSRAAVLLLIAVLVGPAVVLGLFVALLPRQWRMHSALTAAIVAMACYDVAAMTTSGSYWRDYLFALVPVTALAAAAIIGSLEHGSVLVPWVVAGAAVSAFATLVTWVLPGPVWISSLHRDDTGRAVAAAAQPADTLTVFGGRADIQLQSGMPSPYTHLWSLPMRTLDPELAELTALVSGQRAPTWLVEVAHFEVWQPEAGARLRDLVEERYVVHVPDCGDAKRIWRLREAPRPAPEPRC